MITFCSLNIPPKLYQMANYLKEQNLGSINDSEHTWFF